MLGYVLSHKTVFYHARSLGRIEDTTRLLSQVVD
jgi:hypothetical protein